MDFSLILGLALGVGGIALGNLLEGAPMSALFHFTAAVIVFGGTFGATIVSNNLEDIHRGIHLLVYLLKDQTEAQRVNLANKITKVAQIVRKESLLALEKHLAEFTNPYLKSILRYGIDGVDPKVIRSVVELEMDREESKLLRGAKIWADAGGYAPTIGIIGAVLGLINVMANLSDTSELGAGIAVAFVATIYGVASANLVFLPISEKLKAKIETQRETHELVLDGVLAIFEKANPLLVTEKIKELTSDVVLEDYFSEV